MAMDREQDVPAEAPLSGTLEDAFLRDVRSDLADVPRRKRREVVAVAAANLSERPATSSWDRLIGEVGTPREYADALREEHGLPQHVGIGGHLKATRWSTRIIAVVLVLAFGSYAFWQWANTTADPQLHNSCGGTESSNPGVTYKDLEAAGASERQITYVDGATVTIPICLTAEPGTEILHVSMRTPSASLFVQTGVRAVDWTHKTDEPDPTFAPPMEADHGGLWVDIDGKLANCEDYSGEGGGIGFDRVWVTYRYRGHTHTLPLDLGMQYTFLSPPDEKCPRPRDHG